MIKIKRPSGGFFILASALVFLIAGAITYALTYSAFHYSPDRLVTALVVIAVWAIVSLLVNALLGGNKPFIMDIFFVIAVFCITVAAVKFIIPCLSPIGIYFTVHNMGDVEANAVGVPRSIVCVVFLVLSVICVIVSAFFNTAKEKAGND